MSSLRRDTIQKRIVLRFFEQARQTFATAQDIYTFAREIIPTITLATIYRNVDKLVEEGEVIAFPQLDGKRIFALRGVVGAKSVFFCERCGDVQLLPAFPLPKAIDVQNAHNVRVQRVHTVLYGLCQVCK